jgi:hypothetical protein
MFDQDRQNQQYIFEIRSFRVVGFLLVQKRLTIRVYFLDELLQLFDAYQLSNVEFKILYKPKIISTKTLLSDSLVCRDS